MGKKPEPCKHKWKDFKWYYVVSYERGRTYVRIYEPYVCIYCKERKNVVLDEVWRSGNLRNNLIGLSNMVNTFLSPYRDHLGHRAIIEDEIHDLQLVDRAHLEAHEKLRELRAEVPKIGSGDSNGTV